MKVDLDLTKVFITIYETKNLTHAADLLHLSQPSVSYSLNRLRDQLNDKLFIRNRHGVSATKIADQLYPLLKKSIVEIESAYAQVMDFNPLTAEKTFKIGLSDIGEICLLPKLMKYFLKHAPKIKLIVEEVSINNVERMLEEDKIDIAIFNSSNIILNKVKKVNLFSLRYVCIANKNNSYIQDSLTLEKFLHAKHVSIKSSTGHLQVFDILKSNNVDCNIALEVPHFSVLEDLIASTELLVTVPIDAAQAYLKNPDIKMFELPFDVNDFWVSLHWFEHTNDIKARNWLIDVIQNIFKERSFIN